MTGKLLIISNMAHYSTPSGVVGHGATVREISELAALFDQVDHIGCLHQELAPASALPYTATNIKLIPVPPAGGKTFSEKLRILALIPYYIATMRREIPKADYIHVRAPANIPLLAILLLSFLRYPSAERRWIKYAGNWETQASRTYAFQKWWLQKGWQRSWVTVNGGWENQPSHVKSFFNPCLTDEEIAEARGIASEKTLNVTTASAVLPLRLLFVGGFSHAKGVDQIIPICLLLREKAVPFHFDLIGDGELFQNVLQQVKSAQLEAFVTLHGALPRAAIATLYATAHLNVLPSQGEGFPKVLSEGMAYGVVPLASDVSSIGQYFQRFQTGQVVPIVTPAHFVEAICDYWKHPYKWKQESQNAVASAHWFSYTHYLDSVKQLFQLDSHGTA